jgi:hypothetical protein
VACGPFVVVQQPGAGTGFELPRRVVQQYELRASPPWPGSTYGTRPRGRPSASEIRLPGAHRWLFCLIKSLSDVPSTFRKFIHTSELTLRLIGPGALINMTNADIAARRFEELNPKHRPSQVSPLPDPVRVETPALEPGLRDWKAPTDLPHGETTVEVVVQQRSGLFASASTVELGVGGMPIERRVSDAAAVFGPKGKKPFGLWRVTVPPGRHLGLDPRLPLPSQHMLWDSPSSFWSTTQGIESLTESVSSGGAGISPGNLCRRT